jgi:ubiquinone/menaquinone biosynthesis C-methylase UbiE
MSNETTAVPDLKQRLLAVWSAGDFGRIAQRMEHAGDDFVSRLHLDSSNHVLDVACGTGNVTLPAARTGATVTGCDIVQSLLDQAAARAAAENLKISLVIGDAEQLPFADGSFNTVISMFGAMFAPRPALVARELLRVCAPGGRIAMGSWTREGFIGEVFALTASFAPPPPDVPSALLWGNETTVQERFAQAVTDLALPADSLHLQMKRYRTKFELPVEPRQVVELFREFYGPTVMAYARLTPERQDELTEALTELWTSHNAAPEGSTLVWSEYLEVVVTRS